ncbi:MAG: hypothetical protein KKD18_02570, partial [Nanoarchaeota archaeon]|nr:hypothetical protein [Nanoarchaeota archaeon]
NTTDLYAYEINFNYDNTIGAIQQYYFLGSANATYGYNTKNGILSIYGSRLNPNRVGVNSSGMLFNVSYSGSLALRYTLEIYGNGTEIYTYYNNSGGGDEEDDGGGGGGSGGGGGGVRQKQLEIVPDPLKITLIHGRTTREIIKLRNLQNNQVQIQEVDSGDLKQFIAAFVPDVPFYIPNSGTTDLTVDFFAPREIPADVYTGKITFKSPTFEESLNTIIEVKEEEPLFDLIVTPEKLDYYPGEVVMATMELQNYGNLQNIDVLMYYAIKDFDGNILVSQEGSYAIQNYKLQLVGKLKIPNDAPVGQYLFYARATYPQKDISATGSAAFNVIQPYFSADIFGGANLFLIILLPIAVLAIIIVTIIIIVNVTKERPSAPSLHPTQSPQTDQ